MSDEISQGVQPPITLENQDYWDTVSNRVRAKRARFDEEEKPQEITFMLGWESRTIVKEALAQANEHLGTNGSAKAIKHVCEEYLKFGPKVRAIESVAIKEKIRNQCLEQLLNEVGPTEAIKIFNHVFPALAMPDVPKSR